MKSADKLEQCAGVCIVVAQRGRVFVQKILCNRLHILIFFEYLMNRGIYTMTEGGGWLSLDTKRGTLRSLLQYSAL
jgi:hypothetical protein